VLLIVASVTGTAGVIVSTGYAAGGRQKILDQFAQLGTNVIIVTPQQSRAVGGRARTGSVVTTLNELLRKRRPNALPISPGERIPIVRIAMLAVTGGQLPIGGSI